MVSFRWTRSAGWIESRCTLCSLVLTSRLERDIHDGQRAHDAAACQQRRLDAARAVTVPEFDGTCPEGHERVGNTYVDTHGGLVCNACRREKYAARKTSSESDGLCCGSVELGVAQDRMGSAKTNRPTRERRTVLSTPSSTRKEAVDS
jgi:hypothetical protein